MEEKSKCLLNDKKQIVSFSFIKHLMKRYTTKQVIPESLLSKKINISK